MNENMKVQEHGIAFSGSMIFSGIRLEIWSY